MRTSDRPDDRHPRLRRLVTLAVRREPRPEETVEVFRLLRLGGFLAVGLLPRGLLEPPHPASHGRACIIISPANATTVNNPRKRLLPMILLPATRNPSAQPNH